MQNKKQHIHFIGICGVGMNGLALAIQKKGFMITGSDKGFYPPVSTYLKNAGVEYYAGWHPELMVQKGIPDIVVVGNVASSTNPEWLYVQKHGLSYISYPELIREYFLKKNSIVCAGTYGKTTTSALLSWILQNANYKPSYMFGGLTLDEFPSAHMSDGEWSVLEGDEYKTARWDMRPKFAHYSPSHLLLTAVQWDHADVYPTEEAYLKVFQKLILDIPRHGIIVASEQVHRMLNVVNKTIIRYGEQDGNNYRYHNVVQSKEGLSFDITYNKTTYHIDTPLFGLFNVENIAGCFAMGHQIGIDPLKIIAIIKTFKGLKRRLEKRYENRITIFDDIAHSPAKAYSVLHTLENIYPGKIIAVFEPNTGNRQAESIPSYNKAFVNADEVIIPRLTKIKIDTEKSKQPMDGKELYKVISQTHHNVRYIDDDEQLTQHLVHRTTNGDVIIFMGSHGFRGIIDILINRLTQT